LKSQLQDTEKQLLRLNQNEQKFKQECEQARAQLAESQRQEATLKGELSKRQGKVRRRHPSRDAFTALSSIKSCVIVFGNVYQVLMTMMMTTMKMSTIFSNWYNNFKNNWKTREAISTGNEMFNNRLTGNFEHHWVPSSICSSVFLSWPRNRLELFLSFFVQ
jgi:DNA repair exonuclease SbcCD ATPase subunit